MTRGLDVANGGSGEPLHERVERLEREVAELRASRKRLVEGADAERRAIEREIHDGVQQSLVALAIALRQLRERLNRDEAAIEALLDEMALTLRGALDQVTALAQVIYPPLLDARGLASALRSAAQNAGLTLIVDIPRRDGYPPDVAAAVYWSCLEVLSSAPARSQATVSVQHRDGAVTVEIEIAGDLDGARLDRLRDRIEALEGRVTVERRAGPSSWIQGELPVPD